MRAAEEQLLLVEAAVGRWEDGRAEAEAQVRATAAEREVAAAEAVAGAAAVVSSPLPTQRYEQTV
eukprot:COSAG01_NODE_10484_length_2155_cov_1.139105_4_plen_64_part_01